MRSFVYQFIMIPAMLVAFAGSVDAQRAPEEARADFIRHIQAPDPAYGWDVEKKLGGNPATTYVVKLTSQSWRTKADVNRTKWEHWLTIVKPEKTIHNKAFLMIGGGSNKGDAPSGADSNIVRIAEATNSVVAELKMVPNQPLEFHGDGVQRVEDDLIGYAWDQYLETGDATWLPRLPMVKSAVRAMDCIQELMASDAGGNLKIEKFVVAGGSKRGWTTWMTGAADPRVAAIVPIVIDVLNVDPSMRHHASVYGFWAEAIGNYVQHGITKRWDDPRMDELYAVVDPYSYLDKLTMPKYIVNSCGDQFFCPDSSKFYFDDLKGEKHLRYVPNTGHSLRGSDAVESIAAFYQMILLDKPRPEFSWTFGEDGSIRVTTKDRPKQVLLWQATNPEARDFRVDRLGPEYKSTELQDDGTGVYVARVSKPEKGWTAFVVELTYDIGAPVPLKMTTAMRVTPDTLPHKGIDLIKTPYEPFLKAGE